MEAYPDGDKDIKDMNTAVLNRVRPAPAGTPCAMVHDGYDTDGSEWNRCTVHDKLVFGDAYVCEGYEPLPYVEVQS